MNAAASRLTAPADRLLPWLLRACGIALLLIPFLPLRSLYPRARGMGALSSPEEWVMGLAIFGTVAWFLAMALHGERGAKVRDLALGLLAGQPAGSRRLRPLLIAGLALLALLLLTVALVFHGKPRLVDAVVQLFQARIFAAGLVTAPAPPGEGFFAVQHMIVDSHGWYAQYPPGHSLLLAIGVLLGVEWLVPVLLSMGTFLLLWAFAREVYGARVARLTAFLAVLCPFFWVMGAGFMNHVSSLFFGAAFIYGFARWESTGRDGWLAAAGAALGIAFLSRPISALAIGAPFALFGLLTAWRRRNWRGPAAAVVAFLLFAGVYLLWNLGTTGEALTPGYVKLWGEEHGLGFHADPWGEVHTPATGLRNELIDLSLLNVFLFEWPIPALLPLGFFFAAGLGRGRWDRRLLLGFLALPAAHFFYWHRDDFLGPRFLYEGLIFVLPLTARAILVIVRRFRGMTLRPLGLFRPWDAATFAATLLVLSLVYSAAFGIPQRFRGHALGWSSMRVDVLDEAQSVGLDGGVILVSTSWGNRILAELRDRGVRPALAQQVYDDADHCGIQELLHRARAEGWSAADLTRGLEALRRAGEELVSPNLNGDPTLKLRADGGLTPACAWEIEYDAEGYTLYLPHLLANDPRLAGRWIVARDLPAENGRLLAAFPGRQVYRYRPGRFEALGVGLRTPLVPVATEAAGGRAHFHGIAGSIRVPDQ